MNNWLLLIVSTNKSPLALILPDDVIWPSTERGLLAIVKGALIKFILPPELEK